MSAPPGTPPGVDYIPVELSCYSKWDSPGLFTQEPSKCAGWRVVAEDGTELTAWREGPEVNGSVYPPDGPKRRAYDPIGHSAGSLPMHSDYEFIPPRQRATPGDLAILNRLRQFALAETWEAHLARAKPCPHTDCHRTRDTKGLNQ